MKHSRGLAFILVLVLLSGCAGQLPQPVVALQNTLEAICELYEQNRDLVVRTRAYLVSVYPELPAGTQADLRRIDAALPALDQTGRTVCEIARATTPLVTNSVRRDELAASLIRLVGIGLQLKTQGVI